MEGKYRQLEEPDDELDEQEEMQLKRELDNYYHDFNDNRKSGKASNEGSRNKKKVGAKGGKSPRRDETHPTEIHKVLAYETNVPLEVALEDEREGQIENPEDIIDPDEIAPIPEVSVPRSYQRRIPKCAKFVPIPPSVSRCCAPKNIRDILLLPFGGVNNFSRMDWQVDNFC